MEWDEVWHINSFLSQRLFLLVSQFLCTSLPWWQFKKHTEDRKIDQSLMLILKRIPN